MEEKEGDLGPLGKRGRKKERRAKWELLYCLMFLEKKKGEKRGGGMKKTEKRRQEVTMFPS